MLRLSLVSLIFAFAGFALASGAAPQATPSEEVVKEIVSAVTDYRKKMDLPPLQTNDKLMAIAQRHADNLARQDKFGDKDNGHVLDGKGPTDRFKDGGYTCSLWSENVGWNQGYKNGGTKMIDWWINSPPHKANLVNKNFTEIGVGAAKGASGKWYYVQDFGRP